MQVKAVTKVVVYKKLNPNHRKYMEGLTSTSKRRSLLQTPIPPQAGILYNGDSSSPLLTLVLVVHKHAVALRLPSICKGSPQTRTCTVAAASACSRTVCVIQAMRRGRMTSTPSWASPASASRLASLTQARCSIIVPLYDASAQTASCPSRAATQVRCRSEDNLQVLHALCSSKLQINVLILLVVFLSRHRLPSSGPRWRLWARLPRHQGL